MVEDVALFQFADDAIFVGEWSLKNAKNLLRVLKCFEVCSGLKINLNKSRLSGVTVTKEEVISMSRRLDCKEESIPFIYLGLPVGGNMKSAKNWQPLIDKFCAKLSSWKAKTLSFGGRCCLCKSVLGALGTYMFSLYKAPKKVINTLEGIRRRFLWGGTSETKKICWAAWEKVIRDKKCGGLGIGSLRALNLALLTKWRWREKTEPNAMWIMIVKSCADSLRSSGLRSSTGGSWTPFAKDLNEVGINVSTFLKPSGDGSSWVWELDSSNIYSVKSLRKLIDGITLPAAEKETEWIRWIPSKNNIHLWRVLSDKLPTCVNLTKRGVVLPSVECPLCNIRPESLDHVMISCSTALAIGAHLTNWVDWWPRRVQSVTDFWDKIRRNGEKNANTEVRKIIGAAFFSMLWKLRNSKVFKGVVQSDLETVREIQTTAYQWVRCQSKGGRLINWEDWICNPANAVNLCTALASR
ncbi:LOW QUALITY PROTEIN: hypothetical protein OSB04_017614 [Centaurea solstitialis]|uniref:Reverse transcriptase domain-containing protein n=1 Tax=Centaurea solstitialis TaxID=347529 RepID=A0AA38T4U8_9ASTR|nr:LOW QUALITY PROTEIN: hypothetical protein OSB04_017614 [Centaurea solstitialis]